MINLVIVNKTGKLINPLIYRWTVNWLAPEDWKGVMFALREIGRKYRRISFSNNKMENYFLKQLIKKGGVLWRHLKNWI